MLKTLALFLLALLALAFPAFAQDDELLSQWAISAEASSEYGTTSWSASQATGEPNVSACGDNGSAWASATPNEVATLTLHYTIPVFPTKINIHQNYNPGYIKDITLITLEGDLIKLDGVGDTPEECPGVQVVEIEDIEEAVNGVIIVVDQHELNSWSEIDAVELVGLPAQEDIIQQWAIDAEASSEYGSDNWSASQAVGAPDVAACGDNTSAWASASATEEASLTVYFATPVIPTTVNIYQTYNPGAIVSLEMLTIDGESYEFDITAEEATTACPGVLSVSFERSDVLVDAIVIHLDQSITGIWNEIDAVELIGSLPEEIAELSGVLEVDGFSINYPENWATTVDEGDESNVPVLVSSEELLTSRNELSEGDVVMTVVLPETLESQIDVDATDDIHDILQAVVDAAELDTEVEDYDELDNDAVIARVAVEEGSGEVVLIVVEYNDGAVLFAIDTGSDFEDVEAQIVAILDTADYEE